MIARILVTLLIASFLVAGATPSLATTADEPLVVAQAQGTRDGDLEPRYQPRDPPEEPGFYNDDYIFALTRGVSAAPIAPAGKAPLYVLTVPLDLVMLPFALIGGFFG